MTASAPRLAWFVGEGTLLVRCVETYLSAGFQTAGVASNDPAVRAWCAGRGITVVDPVSELPGAVTRATFDDLFSIGNHSVLPDAVIAAPARLAINFHYGPLPEYAGVHVPVWALLHGQPRYGVTWHEMTTDVDAGRLVKAVRFDVPGDETAAGLNARCFDYGLQTYKALIDDITADRVSFVPQDASQRRLFKRHDRPDTHAVLDFDTAASDIERLCRALDFASLENAFAVPRVLTTAGPFVVTRVEAAGRAPDGTKPGTVLEVHPERITVATLTTPIAITGLRRLTGDRLSLTEAAREAGLSAGVHLPVRSSDAIAAARPALDEAVRQESFWLSRLTHLEPLPLAYLAEQVADPATGTRTRSVMRLPSATLDGLRAGSRATPDGILLAVVATYLARLAGLTAVDLPLQLTPSGQATDALLSPSVPVRVDLSGAWTAQAEAVSSRVSDAARRGSFFLDVCARYPDRAVLGLLAAWQRHLVLCVADAPDDVTVPAGTTLALIVSPASGAVTFDASTRVSADAVRQMQHQLATVSAALASNPDRRLSDLPLLDDAERARVLVQWNETTRDIPARCVHQLFEEQVARTPDSTAVVFRDRSMTYRELNERADALGVSLQSMGIGPDGVVGVFVDRSLEMVIALLGVLKAGGAYLPLDPAFPQERLAWMLEDTGARVLITQSHLAATLPRHQAQVVVVDASTRLPADLPPPARTVQPGHLAYVIFTSGSTGRPKGVMVEHRNAVNFFVGMDEYLGGRPGATWLAVTSISFDISVLEIFWTLARGFNVVIQEELVKAASGGSERRPTDDLPMDFSLFYFSADAAGEGGNRYRLLLEGAKYADAHDFSAIWTPERHFHNFGGLYPNPAVTSAAVAAVTSRVRVRAGSVVLPLHNPIRVAEEWAVVDNLSQGRVEMSFASGWHANDFALMPENYKDRRDIMLQGIETVKRLWRGESVSVKNGHGEPHEVRAFPVPYHTEPAVWLAAAGNVDTFRLAGRIGARLLTNLLGQKKDDVATKIAAYRAAWREAGHPGEGVVALMLHTFVGPNLEQVRETVRRPLINYLKSSTELVKQARWEFPAFANSGKGAVGEVDLSDADIDAMMEHAFERYFETSGLFGTPDICVQRVHELKAIGVDEIACLIDFGIATDTVLASLPYLNDVRERSQPGRAATGDFTIAAQIERHQVTHLQGTPSLIRTIVADERGRTALSRIESLLVGGEPLPPALATEVLPLIKGQLLNMYGPTETTVWSTVAPVTEGSDVTIGRPVANTQIYIVDAAGAPVPVGVAGELLIGGLGVTRGYWQRPELTADRFVRNTCLPERGDLLYRTGDLARYRDDGRIECLGRIDHQVKVRGHRIELGEIESALGVHAAVAQSVVVVKPDATGEPRLVAYVVARADGAANPAADLGRWQTVWDETYGGLGQTTPVSDPTFDISGWRNSFTGQLMPEADMREWVELTVDRVIGLKPRTILEIGCGTGLLLHRLAGTCEHYTALDFSPTAIARVQAGVEARGLTNVTLRAAAADTLAAQTDLARADVVIINSVAQYFPDVQYLVRVLEQAIGQLNPGGAVFVGDVRSLPLLEAFHMAIELAQAPASMATNELRQRVADRVESDPELVIDPAFFHALRAHLPAIAEVDIRSKRGRHMNEMTRFRYDAILRVGPSEAGPPPAVVPGTGLSLDAIGQLLNAGTSFTVTGIANARVSRDLAAVRLAGATAGLDTAASVRQHVSALEAGGVDPDDLIAAAVGWDVDVRPAVDDPAGALDATFRPAGTSRLQGITPALGESRPWTGYVHQAKADRGQLVQALKQHLRTRLPPYMVPGAFMLLDALPLTPNGKIDRNALPDPDRQRQESTSSYVAPDSEFERTIAETWQDLLALERVGSHDNFFDIGANSLMMIQAHSALRERLGVPLSLVDLFRFPTVAALAAFLNQGAAPSAALSDSEARAQARVEALNRRRQGRQSGRATATPRQ